MKQLMEAEQKDKPRGGYAKVVLRHLRSALGFGRVVE